MSDGSEIRREALRSSGLVGTVAIAEYGDRKGLRDRKHVLSARSRFTELCDRLGFARAEELEGDGTQRDVLAGIDRFVADEATRKILYWTGHGHATKDDGYLLACRDSYEPGRPLPHRRRSVEFAELLRDLTRARHAELLVIIDACESQHPLPGSRGLHQAMRQYLDGESGPGGVPGAGFGILATAGADRQMEESLWVDWLQEALADPGAELDGTVRPFEPTAPFLLVPDLLEAVDRRAEAAGFEDPAQRPAYVEIQSLGRRFLHNPYYEAGKAVYRAAAVPPGHEPWLTPDRFGPAPDGDEPHRFAGRVRPLGRLATWIASQSHGMIVVTGPAGTGKTALLARLALLSVPSLRDALNPPPPPQTVPGPGSVHAAVSCHGASLHSLSRTLLEGLARLGADVPDSEVSGPQEAVDRISRSVPRIGAITVIVDGLDEAMPGQAHEIARRLLNPLARCAGVKLIVGTRPHPRRTVDPGTRESLLDALDRSSPDLELDRDRETERDISALVASLLAHTPGSPYAGPDTEALRSETAHRVARTCGRRFLVARLVGRELARQPAPLSAGELDSFIRHGGTELRTRMTDELTVLDPGGRHRLAELLLPLAVVQGPGLADPELWLKLANKLRAGPRELTRDMLDTMLRRLKGVLVTAERRQGRRPLYRLDHTSYGTALLARFRMTEGVAHRRVYDALHRPAGDWDRADDYTVTYLAAHAAQATADTEETLDEQRPLEQLFLDPAFLVATEPDVMLPLTGQLINTCEGAALYRRVGAVFRDHAAPGERRAVLRAEAFVGHPEIHRELWRRPGFAEQAWEEVWTDAVARPPELTLPAPLGGAIALSWTPTGGGTLSIAGRGEIVGRRADTGAYVLTRRAHDSRGTSSVFAEVREVTVRGTRVTASHDGRSLHLWWGDERRPHRSYTWDGRIGALDVTRCGDGFQVVAADGKCVWAWRWTVTAGRTLLDGDVRHDILPVPAERLALLSLPGHCFLLTAGDSVALHELRGKLYADRSLVQDSWELPAAPGRRYAAAALPENADGGFLALAEGGADGERVVVRRVTATGRTAPRVTPVLEVASPAREIALGRCGDLPLLALHEGHRVRLVSPVDATVNAVIEPAGERRGLAFDPRGTGRLAVGDGDEVRVVDTSALIRTVSRPRPAGGEALPRVAVAPGGPGAPALVARTAGDRVLLALHTPLHGRTGSEVVLTCAQHVTAVAASRHAEGWTVAAAAGRRVTLWRLNDDLSGHAEDGRVELSGDAGDTTTGLALVRGPEGSPWLFVPDGPEVTVRTREAGTWVTRRPVAAAQIKVCDVAAYTAAGRTWLAVDSGEHLTLWESTADGFAPRGRRTAKADGRVGLALTVRHGPDGSRPLLAWSEAGTVRLAECEDGRWSTRRFTAPHGAPAALAFAGPAGRPLLLACGGTGTVAVRDVVGDEWVPELRIPYRGGKVHAAGAAHDPRHGLTLFVQDCGRCDQLRIPQDRITAAVRRA
ncbi:AAA family ATPase [Streptomyces sp. DH24]|uniref:AAA family ATPase n=1 Tax=Streptomyces sp. DH24 TaxID=3040123 RepID=UPI002442057F|nr:AAA family ATPase [Streptomyces sp. DH24]MDG9715864.1 AAA family ATPase [Streptomyces sp. DH24]